ncbi:AAA family ATPase [Vogesella indigofera]|uniref:AAA family ATPase n=1 Tax=Vogesella indigofera TaxID=45465 RepID=UPI00234EBECD|nr:AAA family ATPase [Vogesella indigofera]MDC7710475.1 AAA family ATPase [Vogesella indigofera]
MKYCEKKIDTKLREWFVNDHTRSLLREISLVTGGLRGLTSLDLPIGFPIVAVAGKNGAGKSTILALACCAYHNRKDGYRLPKRKVSYYTFSDFFIQHPEELSPQGIEIRYGIAYDKWKKSDRLPDGVGIGRQRRTKKQGGKWNDYADRLKRNVAFLGIDRIVPHSERSQSRSYSKAFKDAKQKGWEDKVRQIVGSILGKNYDNFRYLEYSKYNLPIVKVGDTIYSGFNMGAGENALFEIFSTLYDCGEGALLVIDEIELGLHAEAQRKFIDKLKDACLELRAQVICTTHSKEIFERLPNDARFFVESVNSKTRITDSVSSEFAFSKMGGISGKELDIFVEDDVAKALIIAALPASVRTRIAVTIIGSANCLARQLAATYLRNKHHSALAVFDGDQRSKETLNIGHARKMAEKVEDNFDEWMKARMAYLPGKSWPEAWLMQVGKDILHQLSEAVGSDTDSVSAALKLGADAGKHNELYTAGHDLGLEREHFLQLLSSELSRNLPDHFKELVDKIHAALE